VQIGVVHLAQEPAHRNGSTHTRIAVHHEVAALVPLNESVNEVDVLGVKSHALGHARRNAHNIVKFQTENSFPSVL
jgi:hypothetical protein